jgi:hypothetical protein
VTAIRRIQAALAELLKERCAIWAPLPQLRLTKGSLSALYNRQGRASKEAVADANASFWTRAANHARHPMVGGNLSNGTFPIPNHYDALAAPDNLICLNCIEKVAEIRKMGHIWLNLDETGHPRLEGRSLQMVEAVMVILALQHDWDNATTERFAVRSGVSSLSALSGVRGRPVVVGSPAGSVAQVRGSTSSCRTPSRSSSSC